MHLSEKVVIKMNKKRLFFLGRIFLGVIILVILMSNVGVGKIFLLLKDINFVFILPILLLYCFMFIFGALNLKVLTAILKSKVKFIPILIGHIRTWGISLILPGQIGEFSMVYYLNKEKVSIGEGSAIVIVDKFISLFANCLFSLIGFYLFFRDLFFIVLIFMVTGLFLLFTAFYSEKVGVWLKNIFLKVIL